MADNCKKGIMKGWHFGACSRKATKDGYCWQHHPDAIAERERKATEAFKAKMENSPWRRLERMREELAMCREIIKYGATTPEEKEYLKDIEKERSQEFYDARKGGEFP
jgi:hypothetical protein